jgi:outer membrane protein OmpA-like peptidoglycan-associated protein
MIRTRLSILSAALAISGLAHAADAPVSPATPATPQAWASRMLDPTENGSAFKDPAVFSQWVNAMMNPATSMALMQEGMNPNTAVHMLSGMMNPAAMQNYMQFTDPSIYMKWIAAGLDPRFYIALLSQGINPENYLRWMMAPVSPQMQNMGAQMLNPGLYGNWMAAPITPATMNAMMTLMNPNTYMNWMSAGMNPQTYGPWGSFMAPPGAPAAVPLNPAEPMKKAPESSAQGAQAPGKVAAATKAHEAAQAAAPKAQAPAVTTTKAVLAADTLFKINKSGIHDLSKEGMAKLIEIADKIKAMGEVEQVRVVGHADNTGKPGANRKLSEARARSVKTYLVAKGVKPGVIITSGMGDTQPVVQCDKSLSKDKLIACLAPNRRVEIDVVAKAK